GPSRKATGRPLISRARAGNCERLHLRLSIARWEVSPIVPAISCRASFSELLSLAPFWAPWFLNFSHGFWRTVVCWRGSLRAKDLPVRATQESGPGRFSHPIILVRSGWIL